MKAGRNMRAIEYERSLLGVVLLDPAYWSQIADLRQDDFSIDSRLRPRQQEAAHETLPVEEFLRRFLLHLLPCGFMRIRNFGFLANRQRAELLPLCSRLLFETNL